MMADIFSSDESELSNISMSDRESHDDSETEPDADGMYGNEPEYSIEELIVLDQKDHDDDNNVDSDTDREDLDSPHSCRGLKLTSVLIQLVHSRVPHIWYPNTTN